MTDLTDLSGRAALITGASRGIGFAIAGELLSRGASVTITARKPDELAAAAEKLVADAAGGDASRVLAVAGNAGSATRSPPVCWSSPSCAARPSGPSCAARSCAASASG